ncbi:MAG: hypothetical protein R3F61_30900 [Myxococcota bacterium]
MTLPMAVTHAVHRVWKFFSRPGRAHTPVVHLHHCAAGWDPAGDDVALELAA